MTEHTTTSPESSESSATSKLLHPVDTMTEAVRHVPGAETVGGMFDKMLDSVGLVSPRARRIAAYTGAGLLGVVGAVDWPVAVAGAAAVWLTQPRPARTEEPGSRPARKSRTTKSTGRTSRSAKAEKPSRKTPAGRSTTRSTADRAAKPRTGSSSSSTKRRVV